MGQAGKRGLCPSPEAASDDVPKLNVLALLHPNHLANFDEVWMMAAGFEHLFIYELWSRQYNIEWRFHDLDGGWTRKVPLADRVKIYYILEHRQVSDTYLSDFAHYGRVMAKLVAEFWRDKEYIWSINEKFLNQCAGLRHTVVDVNGNERERPT